MKRLLGKVSSHGVISFLLYLSLTILPPAVYSEPKTVNFGAASALSGTGAVYGTEFAQAFQLAIAEINAAGGITVGGEKYNIKGISYDTELKPATSIKMALRLANLDKCPVVFVAESTAALSIVKYNEKEKFILMAVTVTPEFTQMGNKLAVRNCTTYTKYAQVLMEEAWKKGIRNVAVYVRSFETSKRWADHFEKIWKAKGGKIVGREECPMGTSDHYSRLTKLIELKPDAILAPAFSDEPASQVIKQARELGYKGKFLHTEAMEGDRMLSMVPAKDVEGSLLCNGSIFLKKPELLAFRERYKAKYPDGVFQPAGVCSYEGVYIIARAMEKAGTVSDVYKIRAAIPSVIPIPTKYAPAGFKKITPEGDMEGTVVVVEFKNGKKEIITIRK